MVIDLRKNKSVVPPLEVNGHVFERIKSYKLLGMWIDDDLKLRTNEEYLVKKASKCLFALKILRNYNAPMEDLKSFYTSVIRSTLEYCVHIWHGNLTHEQTRDIEQVQKRALRIILPALSYEEALVECNLKTLKGRREDMLLYFSSVSGFYSYAIEMLISTIQNAVLLSPVESHQCKWAALANWKGGRNKNIEIDLLQENRNKGIKGPIHLMGQTRPRKPLTELAKEQECVKLFMYLKHRHHLKGHLLSHTCRLPMMTQGPCCLILGWDSRLSRRLIFLYHFKTT